MGWRFGSGTALTYVGLRPGKCQGERSKPFSVPEE